MPNATSMSVTSIAPRLTRARWIATSGSSIVHGDDCDEPLDAGFGGGGCSGSVTTRSSTTSLLTRAVWCTSDHSATSTVAVPIVMSPSGPRSSTSRTVTSPSTLPSSLPIFTPPGKLLASAASMRRRSRSRPQSVCSTISAAPIATTSSTNAPSTPRTSQRSQRLRFISTPRRR
jgi:hypothetical protein